MAGTGNSRQTVPITIRIHVSTRDKILAAVNSPNNTNKGVRHYIETNIERYVWRHEPENAPQRYHLR